jgi:hypothetical protein
MHARPNGSHAIAPKRPKRASTPHALHALEGTRKDSGALPQRAVRTSACARTRSSSTAAFARPCRVALAARSISGNRRCYESSGCILAPARAPRAARRCPRAATARRPPRGAAADMRALVQLGNPYRYIRNIRTVTSVTFVVRNLGTVISVPSDVSGRAAAYTRPMQCTMAALCRSRQVGYSTGYCAGYSLRVLRVVLQ